MMKNLLELNLELSPKTPRDILKHALSKHSKISISFSGAEDVVLIDMAVKINKDVRIFTLDTGRLHPQTYQFIEEVRKFYGIEIEIFSPNTTALQEFTKEKGLFSFYQDGHKECCGVRKIEPLKRALSSTDAWVTGQRKDQSPGTRHSIPVIEIDSAFKGSSEQLIKYNPLANWSSEEVWNYIRAMEIPFNSLHSKGFKSIGCEPCTKAILPNQHEREGRWWWEEATQKECGLHASNISQA